MTALIPARKGFAFGFDPGWLKPLIVVLLAVTGGNAATGRIVQTTGVPLQG
jgi:hypothetical protein